VHTYVADNCANLTAPVWFKEVVEDRFGERRVSREMAIYTLRMRTKLLGSGTTICVNNRALTRTISRKVANAFWCTRMTLATSSCRSTPNLTSSEEIELMSWTMTVSSTLAIGVSGNPDW
jgi:hypothetical protein